MKLTSNTKFRFKLTDTGKEYILKKLQAKKEVLYNVYKVTDDKDIVKSQLKYIDNLSDSVMFGEDDIVLNFSDFIDLIPSVNPVYIVDNNVEIIEEG